jgi:hypothetical protein
VHVLDIIWEAPIERSIAFVCHESLDAITLYDESESIARSCKCPIGQPITAGIPLDLFIRETLRRSRTSCSTLQAALLLCKRVGGEVIRQRAQREGLTLTAEDLRRLPGSTNTYASLQTTSPDATNHYILCSRRIFLASVMVSSKFLQDRTFSNRAWSKISGLNARELCVVERRFLMALEFDLNVREKDWATWTTFLKRDWKASTPTHVCKAGHQKTSRCSVAGPNITRSSLERTNSLQTDELYDTGLAFSSGEKLTSLNGKESENGVHYSPLCTLTSPRYESTYSTPTLSSSSSDATGDSTPTNSKRARMVDSRKAESSLLSTALHNHMLSTEVAASPISASDLPLPFPLRKGLANRSISSF